MSDMFPCAICKAHTYQTRTGLLGHLTEHSTAVLAEEYLKAREFAAAVQRALDLERMCGKYRYKNEDAATAALLKAWRSRSPARRELRAYQCDRCQGGWHLTSQPGAEDVAS